MGLPPNTPLNASIANCTYHLQMSRLVGSSAVPVTAVANESIVGRAAMLVAYLAASEGAAAGWGRFLRPQPQDGTRLLWENTTIMGHSRGASCAPPPLPARSCRVCLSQASQTGSVPRVQTRRWRASSSQRSAPS